MNDIREAVMNQSYEKCIMGTRAEVADIVGTVAKYSRTWHSRDHGKDQVKHTRICGAMVESR